MGEGLIRATVKSGSHSSRADNAVTTFDADVDHIDFGEEDVSKSEGALTTQVTDLAAVRSKRTTAKDSESADEFILVAKRLSVSYKIPLQKQWTDKRKTQTRMKKQTFFH